MRKPMKPIDRLLTAMDRCAVARGEANWTNGYRAAKEAFQTGNLTEEHQRLHAKEGRQWQHVDRVEQAFRKLAQRVLREAAAPASRSSKSPVPRSPRNTRRRTND